MFVGLLLILFVLTIWMCVRIWRRSPLLAIGAFLLWPLTIVALIMCWGDEDSDIRVPFFASLVLTALVAFMAMRTLDQGIDEMAWMLSDADIAEIRMGDPAMADKLEAARARLLAENDAAEFDGDYADTSANAAARSSSRAASDAVQAPAPREITSDEAEAQQRAELAMAVQGLSWRFGVLDLAPAPASLLLSRDFRFVPRMQVSRVARLRGTPLDNDVLGWVVHRQVDLARDDAWYVQVRFVPTSTRLAPPRNVGDKDADARSQALFATLVASQLRSGAIPQQPSWDAAQRVASWHWLGEGADATYHDHAAAMPLRGGVLEFSVPALHEMHAELGTRSTRLMALRTTPKPAS